MLREGDIVTIEQTSAVRAWWPSILRSAQGWRLFAQHPDDHAPARARDRNLLPCPLAGDLPRVRRGASDDPVVDAVRRVRQGVKDPPPPQKTVRYI